MIRTIEPQVIDAMNRRSGIVYIKALNRTENEQAQTVSFDVELYTLESATAEEPVNVEVGTNEEGNPIYEVQLRNVTRPYFNLINRRKAVYRMSTFYAMIGNVTPAQYDSVLMSQIEYVNSRPITGNEIQKDIYFWNLTASDLENVTDEQLTELLAVSIEN